VTLIEAQWLGVPATVTDHDDPLFAAAPGGSVVLPPLRLDLRAEALRELYEHPERASAMGRAAERFAKSKHSPAANGYRRETIYVTARRSGSG
jgi:glycosyltransferase involved in cell wall biosynthesis